VKVKWSNRAVACVQDISDYIALDNPAAAEKWIDTIFDKVQILSSSPEIGRIISELSEIKRITGLHGLRVREGIELSLCQVIREYIRL